MSAAAAQLTDASVSRTPDGPLQRDDGEDSDSRAPLPELFRDLRTSPDGLQDREAARRLAVYGPNTLVRPQGRRWPAELLGQFTQPLAMLLAVAAVLAWVGGTPALSAAVLAVIVLNAAFAFVQERQAERAVDALSAFLPPFARVVRNRTRQQVPATELVPGDVLVLVEGDGVCADARLIDGTVALNMSALTGESGRACSSSARTARRAQRHAAGLGRAALRHPLALPGADRPRPARRQPRVSRR